ncbi:MAG TPA: DsrE/DsrF/DrsH-like family protein, partial [Bacillota bacterium]|nr:DsrE/DsrF/DrsH-like family protein [Bacillota bacterium]
ATAIRFGKSVFDLTDLELAYAPPFSSAKDPVNIAGYAATNILNSDVDVISWEHLAQRNPDDIFILDIREPVEVQIGGIPGAVHIPLNELRGHLDEIPKEKEIIVYCQVGQRAYLAARILKQHGFASVRNLNGGYKIFKAAVEESDKGPLKQKATGIEQNQQDKGSVEEVKAMKETIKVNACGLQCPGPILQLFNKIQQINDGDVIEIVASDPGFANDVAAWCTRTGNTLLGLEREPGKITARIEKGSSNKPTTSVAKNSPPLPQDKTIVVFSGDLDKAIASFIIATGAASMGRKVTMFFTFWGLNILRKPKRIKVAKGLLDKMFGMMMPRGSTKLGLSRMNMAGMGPKMIRMVMGKKNIASLESLIGQARMMGIRLVACQMSMDVMGIKSEELIEGVEIGGVASYLAAAEEGNVNLFI